MRVHVRHQQREIRSNTLFAILIQWNALYACFILLPAIWINFAMKAQSTADPMNEVESIWYGSVLVLWTMVELPRLWLGISGNREHLFAPFLQFFLLTIVTLCVMLAFAARAPKATPFDKGLASVQLIFAFVESILWCFLAPGMVHQNTVDFYAHLWAKDPSYIHGGGGIGAAGSSGGAAGAAGGGPGASAAAKKKNAAANRNRRKRGSGVDWNSSSDDDEGEKDDVEMDDVATVPPLIGGQPVLFTPIKKGFAGAAAAAHGGEGGTTTTSNVGGDSSILGADKENEFLSHAQQFRSDKQPPAGSLLTAASTPPRMSQHPSALNSPTTPLSAERRRPAVTVGAVNDQAPRGSALHPSRNPASSSTTRRASSSGAAAAAAHSGGVAGVPPPFGAASEFYDHQLAMQQQFTHVGGGSATGTVTEGGNGGAEGKKRSKKRRKSSSQDA